MTEETRTYLEVYDLFLDDEGIGADVYHWLMCLYVEAVDSEDIMGCLPGRYARRRGPLPESVEEDPLFPNDLGIYVECAPDDFEMSSRCADSHGIPHPETLRLSP